MLRRSYALASIPFALSMLAVSDATAAGQRSFVSASGVDNPTCSIAAPCRSFGAAITATASGGEVIVLDSGGYGIVTITKAVSIIAPSGVYAGISVLAGNDGVTVSAGPADKVVLRGLTINGQGGQNGINFTSGQALHIHDCVVSNMVSNGIQLKASGATVLVTGTLVHANQQAGIYLEGAQTAMLDAVRAEGNQYGIYARSGPSVTIRDSIAANNHPGGGFNLDAESANTAMNISNSVSSNNFGPGVVAQSIFTGRLYVDRSLVRDNGGAGIRLVGSGTYAILTGNVILRSQDCIDMFSSALAYTFRDNAVADCPDNVYGGTLIPFSPI